MVTQRQIHTLEGEIPAGDGIKRVPDGQLRPGGPKKRVVRMKRLADPGGVEHEKIVRNRIVIQEMRMAYDQLTGVGDCLLDYKLATFLRRPDGIGGMGRVELRALNYDLAKLAASIFGPVVARNVYDRVSLAIDQAFA